MDTLTETRLESDSLGRKGTRSRPKVQGRRKAGTGKAQVEIKAPVTRTVTLGFAPPPRLNVPTTVSYTEIDNRTGEKFRIPIAGRSPKRSQEEIFRALLKMTLLELANELNVDGKTPPAWIPGIDDALEANLMLTASHVHARLFEELVEEEKLGKRPRKRAKAAAPEYFDHLPPLLSKISLALEDVERDGGLRDVYMDSSDSARGSLVRQTVEHATAPIHALERMFEVGPLDIVTAKLGTGYLGPQEDSDPIGKIDDLVLATTLAWTANLTTSAAVPRQARVGFWLCNPKNEPISKSVVLDLKSGDDGICFDLDLSERIGRSELKRMNLALGKLVQLAGYA